MAIIILGSGAFAREAFDFLQASGRDVVGFFSGVPNDQKELRGRPIYYNSNDIPRGTEWVIGTGRVKAMKDLMAKIGPNILPAPAVIHPFSSVGSNVTIGNGSIVCPGSIISCDIVIGQGVLVNYACTVGHDVRVGNLVHLSPNTSLSGYVEIGDECEIGTGTSTIPKIKICSSVIVGAGTVVNKNITEPGVYVGVPAKKIK